MTQLSEVSQLHRITGQLVGVEKMITQRAKPHEIIQQIEAVRGSLLSLEKKIIGKELKHITNPDVKKCYDYIMKLSS